MIIKKIISQNKGMSLVQVMIAVALSGVISLLLVELFSSMTKVQSRARADGEVVQLVEDIRTALTRSQACKETLVGIASLPNATATPLSLNSIKDAGGFVLAQKGSPPLGDNSSPLTVLDITLGLNNKTPTIQPNSLLVADLTIALQSKSSSMISGSQVWQRKITLTIETNASNNIVSCNTMSIADRMDMEKVTCHSMQGAMKKDVCDLTQSKAIVRAACQAIGMRDNGEHCAL